MSRRKCSHKGMCVLTNHAAGYLHCYGCGHRVRPTGDIEVFMMKEASDPGEFGAGHDIGPGGRYWRVRADMWRAGFTNLVARLSPLVPPVEFPEGTGDVDAFTVAQQIASKLEAVVEEYRNLCQQSGDLLDAVHDGIAANLAFREKGGALPDEDMPTFCDRLIAERDREKLNAEKWFNEYEAASSELTVALDKCAEHVREIDALRGEWDAYKDDVESLLSVSEEAVGALVKAEAANVALRGELDALKVRVSAVERNSDGLHLALTTICYLDRNGCWCIGRHGDSDVSDEVAGALANHEALASEYSYGSTPPDEALRARLSESQLRGEGRAVGSAWVVIDENGYPTFTVGWKEGAHDHIKDALDAGNDEAAKWVVREYVPAQGVRNV